MSIADADESDNIASLTDFDLLTSETTVAKDFLDFSSHHSAVTFDEHDWSTLGLTSRDTTDGIFTEE